MLNYAPYHEVVRESGNTAPHILNMGTTWMWVIMFTFLLYLWENSLWKHWKGGSMIPIGSLGRASKKKIPAATLNLTSII